MILQTLQHYVLESAVTLVLAFLNVVQVLLLAVITDRSRRIRRDDLADDVAAADRPTRARPAAAPRTRTRRR